MSESIGKSPARMSIANIATGESIEAEFNPTEFEESLEVNWSRQTVPGLSHQPMQFTNTGNTKYLLELLFDALEEKSLEKILRSRRFLQSLCYPRRAARDVASGGPPRALFVWPKMISLTCVITSLNFRYSRFLPDGTPTLFTANVEMDEIRDTRLDSEEVLANGTQRSAMAPAEEC